MKLQNFLLGATVGFLAGYVTKSILNEKVAVPPELILRNVKKAASKKGRLTGSWILMQPEQFENGELEYNVYKGGISRDRDGVHEQFEFIADAKTGAVINFTKTA